MGKEGLRMFGSALMQVLGLRIPESVGGPTQPIAEAFGNGKYGLAEARMRAKAIEHKLGLKPDSLSVRFHAAVERLPYEKSHEAP